LAKVLADVEQLREQGVEFGLAGVARQQQRFEQRLLGQRLAVEQPGGGALRHPLGVTTQQRQGEGALQLFFRVGLQEGELLVGWQGRQGAVDVAAGAVVGAVQGLGGLVPPFQRHAQFRQVVEAGGDVGVVLAQLGLPDLEAALEERLRLAVPALIRVQQRQVVE
jgi:hypothetical protein